eukprot:GHVU01082291.1.p1 GENE.GHVU01082291.1~~GHVU01082291.1.p1  ORF type:complete len:104 (+),score=6.49 GHVU01082291.1:48-314(+)
MCDIYIYSFIPNVCFRQGRSEPPRPHSLKMDAAIRHTWYIIAEWFQPLYARINPEVSGQEDPQAFPLILFYVKRCMRWAASTAMKKAA